MEVEATVAVVVPSPEPPLRVVVIVLLAPAGMSPSAQGNPVVQSPEFDTNVRPESALLTVTAFAVDGPGLVTVKVKVPCWPLAIDDGPLPLIARSTENQPMSRNNGTVRSRLWVRSGLIAGSIRRLGNAEVSQCATDDDGATMAGE